MTTDFRALCAELLGCYRSGMFDDDLALRARAALAEPVAEGPTTADLRQVFDDQSGYIDDEQVMWAGDFYKAARTVLARWGNQFPDARKMVRAALAEPEPEAVGPSDEELDALWFEIDGRQGLGWKSFARAVLARWGNHFPDTGKMVSPTTEGEVAWLIEFLRNFGDELMNEHGGVAEHNLLASAADLLERQASPVPAEAEVEKAPAVTEVIAWLRTEAEIDDGFELTQSAAYQRRAADLLERQAAPVPVAVAERLPGAEDCDGEGRCWWGRSESDDWSADWTLATPEAIAEFCEFSPRLTWLPAHALPLPSVEVE